MVCNLEGLQAFFVSWATGIHVGDPHVRCLMPGTSPSYLVRHRQILYFRRLVPSDLVPLLGRREIRASLHTAYLCQGRKLSSALFLKTEELFRLIRRREFPMPISEIQIRSIISQWLRDEKQKAEADMLMRTPPHTEDSLRHHMLCLEEVRDVADSAAQRCDYRPFALEAQSLLALHNLEREASEIDFRRLCNELAKASKSFCGPSGFSVGS